MESPQPLPPHQHMKIVPPFLKQAGRMLNSGQARTLLLTGNVYDLFGPVTPEQQYVPLLNVLTAEWDLPSYILIIYELNGPIRFVREADAEKIRDAWLKWRSGYDANEIAIKRMLARGKASADLDNLLDTYDDSLRKSVQMPTLALELLRQMCLCARTVMGGKRLIEQNLVIVIEGAELLLPDAPIHSLSDMDRQRVTICHDWFSDPGFTSGGDSVVLIAESRSLLHQRVARLPQLLEVEVPAPDDGVRLAFIQHYLAQPSGDSVKLWSTPEDLAKLTAGLSLHALAQLLKAAVYEKRMLAQAEVVAKVEQFIQSQLGEDIVEFKKPTHRLEDCVGFSGLKKFLREEFMPRLAATGPEALPGAAVCGPIGGGKTFLFEAVAAELDMVVLVLKNIRSQWFGQTDVIFERLRRVLLALAKVIIFVDEADTQFGGVGADTHETERRLTGKLQAMMSDDALRGRVAWLLITARIHQLSPDIRRPGRVGDLIIPILDPEGEDRDAFLRWTLKDIPPGELTQEQFARLLQLTAKFSTAGFAALRSELKAKRKQNQAPLAFERILAVVTDLLPPAIEETRRYQTLQALVNCTRRSLLPDPGVSDEQRIGWAAELRQLEARGVR
jgi:hypothetical protein